LTDVKRWLGQVGEAVSALRKGFKDGRQLHHDPVTGVEEPGRLRTYFDEHTEGPGLWKWLHYFPIYERHFAKFVGKAPTIVEIGIFSGGSIEMWLDYFGEGTQLHGVDIEPACKAYEAPNVTVSIGDQADPAFWADFLTKVPSFDIVIDDGGHEARQQIATLQALLPHLNGGGVFLCEDIHGPGHGFHSYVDGLARALHLTLPPDEHGHRAARFQRAIDGVHRYPFVTVIEKRDAPLERLIAPKHGSTWEPFYEGRLTFPGEVKSGG
jgi:hypothetical protein